MHTHTQTHAHTHTHAHTRGVTLSPCGNSLCGTPLVPPYDGAAGVVRVQVLRNPVRPDAPEQEGIPALRLHGHVALSARGEALAVLLRKAGGGEQGGGAGGGGAEGRVGVRRGYKGLQGFTRGYKGFQGLVGVTRGYKGLQGATRGYKGLQGWAEGAGGGDGSWEDLEVGRIYQSTYNLANFLYEVTHMH